MKLCTFEIQTHIGKIQRIGAVVDNNQRIIDINFSVAWRLAEKGEVQPYRIADAFAPSTMLEFIQGGDSALEHARGAVHAVHGITKNGVAPKGDRGETLVYNMNEVKLRSPLPKPAMLRDYYTFEKHVSTMFKKRNDTVPPSWYEIPVHYKQNPNSVIGPYDDVRWPSFTEAFDYELELACVIGKQGSNITAENAHEYVFGYVVMNDFSARDVQRKEMAVRMGPAKGKDFATSIGPWIVTKDEVPNAYNLRMTAKINGELWSDGNSGTMQHSFEKMVEFTSNGETIYPGEVWGSGTVGGGCGAELDRQLKPGDVMELEIEHIGVLENKVVK